jgi:hypothetical protein
MPTITITVALGNTLCAAVMTDGSYRCPFCAYGVESVATGCGNPMCEANPACTPAGACKILEARAKNAREQEANRRMLARRAANISKRPTLR